MTFGWVARQRKVSRWRRTTANVQREITLSLGYLPPLILMVFPCLCLLWRWWIILAWIQRLWGLKVMVVTICEFVGRHWSQNTPMTLFLHHTSPYPPWSVLHIYWQGLVRRECNQLSRMMVKLTHSWWGEICRSAYTGQRRAIRGRGISWRNSFTMVSRRSALSPWTPVDDEENL